MRVTRDALTLRWMLPGFQEPNTLGTGRASQRNLMGFKDGTANLDAGDERVDGRARVGRASTTANPTWAVDWHLHGRATHPHARRVLGPHRVAHARGDHRPPQGLRCAARRRRTRPTSPHYASDPNGSSTPLTAHIRLANPRIARDREEPHPPARLQLLAGLHARRPARPRACCSSASSAASPMASSRCSIGSTARPSRSTSGRSAAASSSRFRVSLRATATSGRALLS